MIRKKPKTMVRMNERGSTLILGVLLSLILSASAIVALRDVARTTQAAAVFRTRSQAQLTSDAADRLFGDWAGNKAATLLDGLERSMTGDDTGQLATFGGSDLVQGGADLAARRDQMAIAGGVLEFSFQDLQETCAGACVPMIRDHDGDVWETGLFQSAGGAKTFETR